MFENMIESAVKLAVRFSASRAESSLCWSHRIKQQRTQRSALAHRRRWRNEHMKVRVKDEWPKHSSYYTRSFSWFWQPSAPSGQQEAGGWGEHEITTGGRGGGGNKEGEEKEGKQQKKKRERKAKKNPKGAELLLLSVQKTE